MDRNSAKDDLTNLERHLKQSDRSGVLIAFLLLCVFAKLNYVRDAWIALQQPDVVAALSYFDEARGGVANNLFAIGAVLIPLVLYVPWLFAAVRNASANDSSYDGPAPGTAILNHILPPFLLMAPYQIMLSLYRSAAEKRGHAKDGAGVFVTSLWWGTLWLAIILEVIRQITSRSGAIEMSYFQLSFAVSSLGGVCALSLARLVWKISR